MTSSQPAKGRAVASDSALKKSNNNNDEKESQNQPLRRQQGLIPLTALGVGAVISGDFFGWNFGLDRGGFGGLIISTLIVGLMYVCVSLSLAELAAMYPSAEGAFAFSRKAFSPYAGFLCGLSESLEYVLLVPVIITGLGDHLNILFGIDNPDIQVVWWILLCIIYLSLHLWGPQPTFWSNTIITALSVFTLFLYWCACLSILSDDSSDTINDRIYNIPPDPEYDSSKFLPKGVYGIFTSLVFSAWFFIAVEELPLAGEDAVNPTRTIPLALIFSIAILMVTAFLTAFFAVSVPGGSYNIKSTGAPLVRSLIAGLMDKCVNLNDPLQQEGADVLCNNSDLNCEYNEDELTCWDNELSASATAWEVVINIGTLIGLFTSCHAIIFAGGRQLYSLTRNGTFPAFTRFDRVTNGTPRVALTVDIILSFIVSLIVYFIGEGVDFLVGLSVAAACVSYMFSMCSFIKLRINNKDEVRPYKSPLGIAGAGYAAVISLLIGISFFVDIAVGLGSTILIVVVIAFISIYFFTSIEFLYGCLKHKKSGQERFLEYESKIINLNKTNKKRNSDDNNDNNDNDDDDDNKQKDDNDGDVTVDVDNDNNDNDVDSAASPTSDQENKPLNE